MNTLIKIKLISVLLPIWVVLLSGCDNQKENRKQTSAEPIAAGQVFLDTASPKKDYLETIKVRKTQYPLLEPLSGKIIYDEKVTTRVKSPVNGRVVAPPIELGQHVVIGQSLLQLNSPDVADIEADYLKAAADVQLASRAFNRQKELYEAKAVSRKDFELAEDEYLRSKSEAERALDRLKNLKIQPGKSDGFFDLRSPVTGDVVVKQVNLGMEVRADADDALFVVSDISKLIVIMNVYESNLSKITLGQQLSFTVPAYPDTQFLATINYIGQVLDESTRSIEVRCEANNTQAKLLPGMFASLQLKSEPDTKAIVLPLTAIFTEGDADYVFMVLDDNRYEQRKIKVAYRLKNEAVILDGIAEGEDVVSKGALMLRAEEDITNSVVTDGQEIKN
jgi:membrane fusion protein, heavy metal efflux system